MTTLSKTRKAKEKEKPTPRKIYTTEQREKARKYYLMGLNMEEISKLLDGCPFRTIEKWQNLEQWKLLKKTKPIEIRALELKKAGKTVKEIAKLIEVSEITVWRYTKKAIENEKRNPE